jgi:hypothetical protein
MQDLSPNENLINEKIETQKGMLGRKNNTHEEI